MQTKGFIIKRVWVIAISLAIVLVSCKNGVSEFIPAFDNEPFSLHEAYSGLKLSLPTPQTGHTQSSGISSKAVPGAMPPSGSPSAGS